MAPRQIKNTERDPHMSKRLRNNRKKKTNIILNETDVGFPLINPTPEATLHQYPLPIFTTLYLSL